MRLKKPHVATADQVRITRKDETAIIKYLDPAVATIHLDFGPAIHDMTDQDILDFHNEGIRIRQKRAEEYTHIAVEIPPGRPQIE